MIKDSRYISLILIILLSCNNGHNYNNFNNQLIDSSVKSDSAVVKLYLPFKKKLEESLMNKPLAYSKKTYKKNDGELNSTLSNFFADVTYEMTNDRFKKLKGEKIDVVLLNNGGIRSIISKGAISQKTAFELMPFENSIVVVKLSGQSINSMVEYLRKVKLQHPLKGLNIVLNNDYSLNSAKIDGNEIINDKFYNVATTDYLLNGGDKMNFFAEGIEIIETGYKMRDILVDYFTEIDTLELRVDKRFTINK